MPYHPSPSALKIIALLKNARELSFTKRTMAKDVVCACKLFAKSQGFSVSEDIFDIISYSIMNKQQSSINEDFENAEEYIIRADMNQKN